MQRIKTRAVRKTQAMRPAGAKQAAEKLEISGEIGEKRSSGVEARAYSAGFMRG